MAATPGQLNTLGMSSSPAPASWCRALPGASITRPGRSSGPADPGQPRHTLQPVVAQHLGPVQHVGLQQVVQPRPVRRDQQPPALLQQVGEQVPGRRPGHPAAARPPRGQAPRPGRSATVHLRGHLLRRCRADRGELVGDAGLRARPGRAEEVRGPARCAATAPAAAIGPAGPGQRAPHRARAGGSCGAAARARPAAPPSSPTAARSRTGLAPGRRARRPGPGSLRLPLHSDSAVTECLTSDPSACQRR